MLFLHKEYPQIVAQAPKFLTRFLTTYLSKKTLLLYASAESKYINAENDMKFKVH